MKKIEKILIAVLLAIFLTFSFLNFSKAQEQNQQTQTQTSSEVLGEAPLPAYFFPDYGRDPTAIMPWQQEYCNKSGMDFIVMTTPDSCEPAIVRSDILEEQDVPVFCRLTAIKINPLIQVPYIKKIELSAENKSPEVLDIAFFPARAAFSYYDYGKGKEAKELEGFPSMNNIGNLMIRIKKQPVEAKMPSKVIANLTTRITYDVAKTFGISEHKLVLRKMSDEEWRKEYKKYGFWNGRGFLRLMKLEGTSRAEIALYVSPTAKPIFQGILAEGEKTKEIKLPYFYCDAGPSIQLEKISKPEARARLLVNGNELLLSQNDEILDSGCKVSEILPSRFSYAGKVEIKCFGKTETLSIAEAQAELMIEKESKTYSIGDEIKINDKYLYVGLIGRTYEKENGNVRAEDFVILYEGKTQLRENTRETISTVLYEIDRSLKEAGKSIFEKTGPEIRNEILQRKNDLKDLIGDFYKIRKGEQKTFESRNIRLIKATGYTDPTYSREVEKAFEEAIKQYTDVAHAYSSIENPEGNYGILSLRKAAELAAFFDKREKQKEILLKIIDKYSDSDNFNVLREVDAARADLAKIVGAGGKTTTILTTPQGDNFFVQLLAVERPGLNTLVAHLKINGSEKDLTESDFIDDNWYITKIEEDSVEFQEIGGRKETLAKGNWIFLNSTKVELLSTTVNLEATVVVLPFESNRVTEANFSIAIGIEKRLIQLSPEKIKSLVTNLNKTINKLESLTNNMGKIVTAWKKACFIGGTALWLKNFVTGLSGESFARRKVMEKWKIWCEKKDNRMKLIEEHFPGRFDIPISTCYKLKEKDIEKDIEMYKEAVKKTNEYISKVKKEKDVVSKGGLFGLTQFINEDKFMEAAEKNFPEELKDLAIGEKIDCAQAGGQWKEKCEEGEIEYEATNHQEGKKCCVLKKPEKISVRKIAEKIKSLYENGKLYRDQLNDIVVELYLFKECKKKASDVLSSAICEQSETKLFAFLSPLKETAELPSRKELSEAFPKIEALRSPYASVSLTELSLREMPVYRANISEIANNSACPSDQLYYYTVGITRQGETLLLLEDRGDNTYLIIKGYAFREKKLECDIKYTPEELGIKNTIIVPIDPRACGNNRIKDPEIKFWGTGYYEGMIALMPIIPQSGWYIATQSYTGLEGELVAYKQTGDINTFWICNVGPNGEVDFDFNKGPIGDDAKCCRLISLVTVAEIIIPPFDSTGSKDLIERAKECMRNAKQEYDKGKKVINTGKCGSYRLGKPPTPVPSLECEDFMSPRDCHLLYNLCDPVICPASRCNFGGRYPTENVIAEGIIGSLLLCLPNFDEGRGVLMPICLTGLYNGLDSLTGLLKAYRDCLQEKLATGKTIGICDELHSAYLCEFLWYHVGPLVKHGIPALTEPLRGGGEYAAFPESWKNMIQSLDYFTQVYAPKTIQAFKERSTKQIGTEVCKKFISIVYPSPGKFLEEIAKPEKFPFFWATMQETPNAVTPESHYKVHYIIKAGDTGIYYSVYLRSPPKGGYYEVPEQYFLPPPATGYLPANQLLDQTPDFFAPSGYREICVRINGKDYCDFATVSSSFAVEELQNLYLKDQIKKEIKTTKECVFGTPSIIPVATLNLQQMLQEGISPALYKRGTLRICSSRDPDEGTNENRYERVGYCDNPEIGCWLDMQSVNDSISDLKIRTDVIDYAKQQDYNDAMNRLGLATREQTIGNLTPIENNIVMLMEKFNQLWNELKRIEDENFWKLTLEERNKKIDEKKKEMRPKIEQIENEIESNITKIHEIIEKAYHVDLKARAEYRLAELLDLRARLIGMLEIWEFGIARKQFCEDLGGKWMSPVNGKCPEGYEEIPKEELIDAKWHREEVCCIAKEKLEEKMEKKQFDQWFTDSYKIYEYDEKRKEVKLIGNVLYSTCDNAYVIKIKRQKVLGLPTGPDIYVIKCGTNLYVEYQNVRKFELFTGPKVYVSQDSVVGKGEKIADISLSAIASIYISSDDKLEEKERVNPFCFFTQDILKEIENANKELIQKNKLKLPLIGTVEYEECQNILKEVKLFEAPSIEAIEELAKGTVDLEEMKNQGYNIKQEQIENYLRNKAPNDSPFKTKYKDYAKWFYDYGIQYNIDPAFAIAVAAHESNWSRSKLAKENNNLFGIRDRKGNYKKYDNHTESIKDFYERIRKEYIEKKTPQKTPAQIVCLVNGEYKPDRFDKHCYCTEENGKPGCPKWLENVVRIRKEIHREIQPEVKITGDCIKEAEKLLRAAEYLKDHPKERGFPVGSNKTWCGEYVWNVYRIAKRDHSLEGVDWSEPDPENIEKEDRDRYCCYEEAKGILEKIKPGDLITFISVNARKSGDRKLMEEKSHIMIVGPPIPGKEGKYYVIDTIYYNNKENPENYYFPDILDKKNAWDDGTWRESFQKLHRVIPACRDEVVAETKTPQIQEVFLVASVNDNYFTAESKLVNYNDSVEICAVLKTSKERYSTKEVADKNKPYIKEWEGEKPRFTWYKIIPESKAYDGSQVMEGKQIITYKQEQIAKDEWCITAEEKEGSYWYRVEVSISDKTFSSPGTEQDLNGILNAECGNNRKNYYCGIENVLRISRKSNHPNNFIATIESFKNLPFVGGVPFIQIGSKNYSLTQLYKGMECNTLVAAASELAYNIKLPWQVHDRIEDFIKEFGIQEQKIEGEMKKIEKIPIRELLGMAIEIEEGDIIFFFNEALKPPAYDHSIVIYENKNTEYLDINDTIVYTSSGCIDEGSETRRDGVIKVEGNLCYASIKRFLSRNSNVTLVKKPQIAV
ncbi:MAG: glucosaminidase domain-containing protein [Candidatus Pacearchaeota archaeon]